MSDLLVLEIILDHTDPVIWRKIIVPTSYTVNRLHHAIQIAMGWNNSHLFEFNYEDFSIGIIYTDLEDNPNIDAREITLQEVNLQIGDELKYTYDFGDNWEHTIKVADNEYSKPITHYPYCITGKLNSPPDDVGGITGFYHFVEVMNNLKHKEFQENLIWYGGFFDPLKFSTAKINNKFKRFERYIEGFE